MEQHECVCPSTTLGWACVHTEEKDLACAATCGVGPSHEPQAFACAFSLHTSAFPFLFGWKLWVFKTLLN